MPLQYLTLELEGINAGDYLEWVRDPEPPALDRDLHSITVWGDEAGDRIEAVLSWEGCVPAPRAAASLAGLPLTPEVVRVETAVEAAVEAGVLAAA